MNIDYGRIKAAFPGKAWAYTEQYDSVKIGKWDGAGFLFYEPLAEEYLLLLRVFDENRELKFSGDKCRDTENYPDGDFIPKFTRVKYYMYGEKTGWRENDKPQAEFTPLWEDRGAAIYFPAALNFPQDIVALKLGIRNFARYNVVPVLPEGKEYDFGLSASGAGALEIVDHAYTGFYYADGKAVEL
ncbi:MAG: hypothetical protein LBK56_11180 [Gracilibacteraceae bacterium]|nr:hypothetical protein [Gracilibacteraceae bacterium]